MQGAKCRFLHPGEQSVAAPAEAAACRGKPTRPRPPDLRLDDAPAAPAAATPGAGELFAPMAPSPPYVAAPQLEEVDCARSARSLRIGAVTASAVRSPGSGEPMFIDLLELSTAPPPGAWPESRPRRGAPGLRLWQPAAQPLPCTGAACEWP